MTGFRRDRRTAPVQQCDDQPNEKELQSGKDKLPPGAAAPRGSRSVEKGNHDGGSTQGCSKKLYGE
jgi:hypothetical protein